jgi:hypothetical protein
MMILVRKMPFPFVAPVKGVSFHQDVVRGVEVGLQVEVVAEPENEFDANACAVRSGGETLGHLPREIAARLRAEGGLCWSAEVVEVLHGSKATGLRVRLLAPKDSQCGAGHVEESTAPASVGAGCAADQQTCSPDDALTEVSVFARSGRRLGVLAARRDGAVEVRTDDERLVTYPESLVLFPG